MQKQLYQSKAVWGFGLMGLVIVAQQLKVLDISTASEIVKTIFGIVGAVGIRQAIN